MKRWWLLIGLAAGLMAVMLIGLWWARPLIPSSVRKQISFVVFYPDSHSGARVDRASVQYDSAAKILTYHVNLASVGLIATNQAAPDAFTDVPQSYDKVIASLRPYADFDSTVGKVHLTHPPAVNNQQVAVADAQGTLMFVRAEQNLSQDQWRQFFNNLNELK